MIINQHINKANSPQETLDFVDKNDVVLGTVNREIANKDPRFTHREISILLFDADKNLVIQKRSKYKTVHPGWWSMLAGHVPAGSEPEKVAYQELQEEYGLQNIKLSYLMKKYVEYDHESHFMYYFIAKYSGEKINFDESEIEEVKIVSKSELEEMIRIGQVFNDKYLPILRQIWSGELKVSFFK